MKYLGMASISIGILFIPLLALSLVNSLIKGFHKYSGQPSLLIGFCLGTIFMAAFLGWLDYLLLKWGIIWKNGKKSKSTDTINTIGKPN